MASNRKGFWRVLIAGAVVAGLAAAAGIWMKKNKDKTDRWVGRTKDSFDHGFEKLSKIFSGKRA